MDNCKSVLININTFDKLKQFANIVVTFNSDINIYNGHDYYDAKSIVAVIAMDMSQPRYVEIVSDDTDEVNRFKESMQVFKD